MEVDYSCNTAPLLMECMQEDGIHVGIDVIPSIWNHSKLSILLPT